MDKEPKIQPCIICESLTSKYCKFCDYGDDEKTFYCDECYIKVVQTGNCCSGSEKAYNPQ